MKLNYRADVEASKSVAFRMIKNRSSKAIPPKKKFNKKRERRKNKIKFHEVLL
ncbi:hypothetical protein [Persephonella sp.]